MLGVGKVKFELDSGEAQFQIRGYSATEVTVNDSTLRRSFVLMPDRLVTEWGPQCAEELTAAHVESLLAFQPQLVLLGTGVRIRFPSAQVMRPLIEAGVGYEVMDTRAACRGYAIMSAEGRRVVAAMFPPDAV